MRAAEEVTFGATGIDRAAHLRRDAEALRAKDDARTILLWRGKPCVEDHALVRLPMDHPVVQSADRAPLFLGVEGEAPLFATDISNWEPDDLDEAAMATFFDGSENLHPGLPGAAFVELRGVMADLSPEHANQAATARSVFAWADNHMFCSKCGDPTDVTQGGWQRSCASCGGQHFPRTDPVVIVLVTSGNAVLLGRSPNWPEGMFSLLAGFLEPGETIEAASRREVFEESGIRLGEVTYLSSQPWPYPSSLMFGTRAEALNTDITLDPVELEDARWVSREELAAAMAGESADLKPARKGSIAQFLMERWLKDDLT